MSFLIELHSWIYLWKRYSLNSSETSCKQSIKSSLNLLLSDSFENGKYSVTLVKYFDISVISTRIKSFNALCGIPKKLCKISASLTMMASSLDRN